MQHQAMAHWSSIIFRLIRKLFVGFNIISVNLLPSVSKSLLGAAQSDLALTKK